MHPLKPFIDSYLLLTSCYLLCGKCGKVIHICCWYPNASLFNLWKVWKTCLQSPWINRISQAALWKVWKSYPQTMWISRSREKTEKNTRLSTVNVDNLVENCAEVCLIPVSGSILPWSEPGYRTSPDKCQVNWLPDILSG